MGKKVSEENKIGPQAAVWCVVVTAAMAQDAEAVLARVLDGGLADPHLLVAISWNLASAIEQPPPVRGWLAPGALARHAVREEGHHPGARTGCSRLHQAVVADGEGGGLAAAQAAKNRRQSPDAPPRSDRHEALPLRAVSRVRRSGRPAGVGYRPDGTARPARSTSSPRGCG